MIDPLLSLAYTMQTNKGVYALLVGSGVSRSASVPTGWEIVLDLIEKLAHLQNERPVPDPAQWYRGKYDEEPDYSKLLDAVAHSPEERQQLLARYFEPTETEREDGLKLPTGAHRAIAALVARGYIRVIITTNFDRLIERAIEDEGITPAVLSTPDGIEGALPLIHQRCCVIKLHGDYLDTRIKNTPQELATYDPRSNAILDRILDEFGFVVCGWSAQWDPALQAAFMRCKSRRFTTYWASRGTLNDAARRLLDARAGVLLQISDADTFFSDLSDKIIGLEDLQQPHPLSVASAAATVKRLIADDKHLIRLHDLVRQETERTFAALQTVFDALLRSGDSKQKVTKAAKDFQASTELLRTIGANGAFWARPQHFRSFVTISSRLSCDPAEGQSGTHLNDGLRAIPSVMTLYTMGIAALAGDNVEMLCALLSKPTSTSRGEKRPYLTTVDWPKVQEWLKLLEGRDRQHFPASEWLFENCRETLRPLVPEDGEYDRLFDRFEILRSLVYIDLECVGKYDDQQTGAWGPPGRFVWKFARRGDDRDFFNEIKADGQLMNRIPATGLFAGRTDVFATTIDRFQAMAQTFAQRCW